MLIAPQTHLFAGQVLHARDQELELCMYRKKARRDDLLAERWPYLPHE
jgi:hypothetical protein